MSKLSFRMILAFLAALLLSGAQTLTAQPGEGWTQTTIAPGIEYYTFSGQEPVTGAAQQVFVIDLDLNRPEYALRFSYTESPGSVTSEILRKNNAIVAMNAAYEPVSVVIKVDGEMPFCMPNDVVFDLPVPNWKSEAAVYTDGLRDVRISFDGKGKSIAERRAFWADATDPNILSSAPMLIDNFEPVGTTFVDTTLLANVKALQYEDLNRHQGVRHPRSAIAKTADNHLLLVAVDGRRKGISVGMSARELTRFLVKYFNPQYALNMDGGGSTTLCVRGQGDPETNVVNYPTDNKQYDHAGERSVTTHFYIVEVPQKDRWMDRPVGFHSRYSLEEAVILSRHNLRSPLTGKKAVTSRITPHEWFKWTSPRGELSKKGAVLETIMGQFFGEWMAQEGLLKGKLSDEALRFYSNSLQRTIATARAFSLGMFPAKDIVVEHPYAKGTMNPVFSPVIRWNDEAFLKEALAGMEAMGGPDGFAGIGAAVAPQMKVIERVLDMDKGPAAANDTTCFRTDDVQMTLRLNREPEMTGGLKMALRASDALTLQYYEEPDDRLAAFGHDISFEEWQDIAEVKDWVLDVMCSTPLVATELSRPLVKELLSELEKPGRKFSFLCGHDSNLSSVLGSLGAEYYELPEALEKRTPIGGKLVIGKWKGADGKLYADLHYVYASARQMRSAEALSLANPPKSYPIRLKGLKANADGLYLLEDLVQRMQEIVDAPTALAPRTGVREEVLSDWNKASGLDCMYDMTPKASTPAPKGYKPVYVSHYGRHGSRYAYTEKTYTLPLDLLRKAASQDNLTEFGQKQLDLMEEFWKKNQYKVGDLTPMGWEQHQYIAETMASSFPTAFGADSRVDACSSGSTRSIVSMASACAALSRATKASVYAHQGMLDVQATRPNHKNNIFRYEGPETPFPYPESSEEFFLRRFPNYNDVLARLFKDPSKALCKRKAYDVFFYLYMYVAGMNSLPVEDRADVDGIFTPEEYAILWETDNYERFKEYNAYRTACSSIVDDIIAKADARLEAGETGADLRFGHDHVLMALLLIMNIDGFDTVPYRADDLVYWFQTFRSCMATNLQFVFYTSKKGEPLVKLLFDGEEARFGTLAPYTGPYYRWSDLKEYLKGRVAMFVNPD